MPNSKFLEEFPLYRKFKCEIPEYLSIIPTPAIHMYCGRCKSEQTFRMSNRYSEVKGDTFSQSVTAVRAEYTCAACGIYQRIFLLKFSDDLHYVMKVGQEPPWEISVGKNLEMTLGDHVDYYKKGLVCESQSYGIGAYAYYRRITEEIIDELLGSILDLIDGEEKQKYKDALEETKKTKVTEEKIELVKDLLPVSLRPEGMNPLSVLHGALSEGLHDKNDEECLEIAVEIRESLVYLTGQIIESKKTSRQFTERMRKILEKKREKKEKKKKKEKK